MNWQPIETAPRDGTSVILFAHNCVGDPVYHVGQWVEMNRSWMLYTYEDSFDEATHWAQLCPPEAA